MSNWNKTLAFLIITITFRLLLFDELGYNSTPESKTFDKCHSS